jgi:hypothetical protein
LPREEKAAEGRHSPKPGGNSERHSVCKASWSAPAPWRFWRITSQQNLKPRRDEICRSYGAWNIMAMFFYKDVAPTALAWSSNRKPPDNA